MFVTLTYSVYMKENRDISIKIRLTEAEKEQLLQRSKEEGKSLSSFIRESALKGRSISKTDVQMIYELRKIGANINQLDFLQDNYDIILVDFPGNLKQNGVVETLHFVDVIIIPFEPNQTDLRPTLTFYYNIYEGIIESRRKIGKKTTVRGVMNRVLPNVLEFKEILKNKKTLPFELMQNYIKDSRVDYQRNLSTLSKAYHHPCDAFCEEVLELICNHIGE